MKAAGRAYRSHALTRGTTHEFVPMIRIVVKVIGPMAVRCRQGLQRFGVKHPAETAKDIPCEGERP